MRLVTTAMSKTAHEVLDVRASLVIDCHAFKTNMIIEYITNETSYYVNVQYGPGSFCTGIQFFFILAFTLLVSGLCMIV